MIGPCPRVEDQVETVHPLEDLEPYPRMRTGQDLRACDAVSHVDSLL